MLGKACCCQNCAICSDDFGRADDTDINTGSPAGWSEDSGSWDIASNQLRCTSAGVVHCTTTHPDGTYTMTVSASITHDTSTSSVDVIVGRASVNDYYYARFTFGTGANVAIRQHTISGDTTLNTKYPTLPINTTQSVSVCTDEAQNITVSIGGTQWVTVQAPAMTGSGCGFGANGSGTALIDSFVFEKAYKLSGATDCDVCIPLCEAGLASPCCKDYPTQVDITLPNDWTDPGSCAACTGLGGNTYTATNFTSDASQYSCGGGGTVFAWRYLGGSFCTIGTLKLLELIAQVRCDGTSCRMQVRVLLQNSTCSDFGPLWTYESSTFPVQRNCLTGSWTCSYISESGNQFCTNSHAGTITVAPH